MRLIFIASIFYTTTIFCQEPTSQGATSMSLGSTALTHTNEFSFVNNTAAAVEQKKTSLALYTNTNFLVEELFTHQIVFNLPINKAFLGISMRYQGFAAYNKTNTSIGIAKRLHERLGLGLRIAYQHINTFENFNNKKLFTHLSAYTKINEKLDVGLSYSIGSEFKHHLTGLGIKYHYIDWMACTDVIWDLNQKPYINIGVEYKFISSLFVRAGIAQNISYPTVGLGIKTKTLSINTAIHYHHTLGFSPSLDLVFLL